MAASNKLPYSQNSRWFWSIMKHYNKSITRKDQFHSGMFPKLWFLLTFITCYISCSWHHGRRNYTWWRHQMETFSALLSICAGNSPVTGEFPSQSQVTRSFDVFFDLYLNKQFIKQSWGWWFETPSRSLWRHCNEHTPRIMHPFLPPSLLSWGGISPFRHRAITWIYDNVLGRKILAFKYNRTCQDYVYVKS